MPRPYERSRATYSSGPAPTTDENPTTTSDALTCMVAQPAGGAR
jgi:hypothetical protein